MNLALSSLNWSGEEILSDGLGISPLVVGKGEKLVVFWQQGGDIYLNFSSDNGETWSGSYEIWDAYPNSRCAFLGISATFDATLDTILLSAVENCFDGFSIYLAKEVDIAPESGSWWEIEQIDTITFFSGPLNHEITGPAVSFDKVSGSPLIVWGVKDSLFFQAGGPPPLTLSSGFICEGSRPSLSGNILVYQDGDQILLRVYNSGALPPWSEPGYVGSGEWPYISSYSGKEYVFYTGTDGIYLTYGAPSSDNWTTLQLYNGEANYGCGVAIIKDALQDTFDPGFGSEGEARLPHIWVYYLYTRSLMDGYGIGFGSADLGPTGGFGGGPQELNVLKRDFRFLGIRPNPAKGILNFGFYMPQKSEVVLRVYDVTGRKVFSRSYKDLGPGSLSLPLPSGQLASGVYLYRVRCEGQTFDGKFSILK